MGGRKVATAKAKEDANEAITQGCPISADLHTGKASTGMPRVLAPITIELMRGAAADALLAAAGFCAQWETLCARCPWATPFQSPAFARTWYGVYRSQWEPLLALARDASGELNGLLPLAVSQDGRQLVLAGAHQAEYQTWIALPEVGDAFVWSALQTLRRELVRATLRFRYLPAAAPLGWLDEPLAKRACLLRTHRRPRMTFGDGSAIRESLAKRGNKGRLRRLGKLGKVEFKQITDAAALEALMDDVTLFYDARRMAVNGAAPFANDPLKRAFHVAMMKAPGLVHATALMCGDRIASFHLNIIDRKHVQLSLITHNPMLADYSPGKFHVLLLGKMLMEQGYDGIDLTPGGDPYKERFANKWDEVYTLSVFSSALERRAAAIVETAADRTKSALTRWNIRPARAQAVAQRLARPSALLHLTREWLSSSQEALVYSRDAQMNGFHAACADCIRRDCIADLMAYHPEGGGPTRHEFLADAMLRIEGGQRVYTYAENGRLLHYAWFVAQPPKELAAAPGFELPERSGLIVDCYTFPHARGRGLASASLAAMLHDACGIKQLDRTFIVVPAASATGHRLVERAGFTYDRSCVRQFLS